MDIMTPEQRRAHLVLQGQTLLDEWTARCALHAEADKLYDEGLKIWNEGLKSGAEGLKIWNEGLKSGAEGDKLREKGYKLWREGSKLWRDAVANEFGPACAITWGDRACILGCGERYSR